jgi:hypothetical protein
MLPKVICANIHEGKIVTGCQYGTMVVWDLSTVMESGILVDIHSIHYISLYILKRKKCNSLAVLSKIIEWKHMKKITIFL